MQFHDDEKMNRRHDGEQKQFAQPLQSYDASLAHSDSSQEEYKLSDKQGTRKGCPYHEQEEYEQYLGLSDAWNELLGIHSLGVQAVPNITAVVPPIASDPWNELLHAQGIEVIDLQQVHLQCVDAPLDDFDVEQALHIMQELHVTGTNEE